MNQNTLVSNWKCQDLINMINDHYQKKDMYTMNDLLDYINNLLKFDEYINLNVHDVKLSLNPPMEHILSFFFTHLNIPIDYHADKCAQNISTILIDIFNVCEICFLLYKNIYASNNFILSDINLQLLIFLSLHSHHKNPDYKTKNNKLKDFFDELCKINLTNYNIIFTNYIKLFSTFDKRIINYFTSDQFYFHIWEKVKYDNLIMTLLVNTRNKYFNEINELIGYGIYPNKEEIKILLKNDYYFKLELLDANLITPKEFIEMCDYKTDIISIVDKCKIPLDQQVKNKIMYCAIGSGYKEGRLKKIKKKYDLKFDDECIKIFCDYFTDSTTFKYLINEGCNLKFHDLCKLLKNINGPAAMHKIIEIILNKSKNNFDCI